MTSKFKKASMAQGNITAICLITSPIPTFVDIVKRKSVGDYSGIPYICTLLNCLLWVVYGLPVVELQVLVVTINAAGVVIEMIYIGLYLKNAQRSVRVKVMKVLLAVLILFTAIAVLVFVLIHDRKTRKLLVGTLCAVFGVGMYISPLAVMRLVIWTRSVEYMPFLLSLFNFINGLVWFGYAVIGHLDIFIAIPNCLGALSGVAQLSLYAYFRPATPTVRDRNEEKGNSMKWVSSSVSILVEQNDHPPLNQPCGSIEALQICEKASN
ncbi:bidirectional sugar transporter SWEET4 isoform X2 [Physcomitrium patens]|uniref:Bidirectional sugar transporter SWEET n=1 Tax=Physcomitrium patens TaxID=3218 RepID=A0A2K1J745_PHYPA|nr:bidirectional sugar transporter SWEET4-like isoform X2 [Physcomitrium patens]XP_024398477.1 bidirectional sugar transporter SWEET4-like isoform X2 [Physcomitrium patens]PNR37347.1 hypothetical protein PHYPA_020455 [Physcomitrium patens]|eukprot:XP_024398476.1 bidirectional sugar transporter SWEET4-like isoform X2 [Physcomitrella patens]